MMMSPEPSDSESESKNSNNDYEKGRQICSIMISQICKIKEN